MNLAESQSKPTNRWLLSPSRSLRTRLFITSIALVLIPVLITGVIATLISSQGLRNENFDQLESVATLKENQIQTWLQSLQTNLDLVLANPDSLEAASTLIQDPSSENANPVQVRNTLIEYNQRSGYFTEIFIMDLDGRVVISTSKDQEGKILKTQSFFHNGLLEPSVTSPSYELSLQNYSVVVSQPLKSNTGKVIGVLAGRANLNTLNEIMKQRAGLGETGETYIVNSNNAVLTSLRFKEITLGQTYINTEGVTNAVQQKVNGSKIYKDYRDVTVEGVYHWIPELQVAVLAEQAESEALVSVNRLLQFTLVLIVITILTAALAAYLITQSITSPISKLAQAAQEISRGNLEQNVEVNQKDEIGILADSFNTMTSQLRDFINTLEQRVAQRTKALATSTEVSRRLSTILDEKQLLVEVVEQIKAAYNYYHGQIYLLDETGQTLVLAGATGEGGQALLNKGHKLSIDRGLVGRAARSKSAVLVPDTSKEPEWVANSLLPDTKAEIAIPILLGDEVLGVIDMQDNVVGDVYQEDVEFLQAIANQVAIALQNSRSYAQAQRRAEREALISSINQKIQNESTVESALQVAIREVGRALGTSARVKLKPSNGQE